MSKTLIVTYAAMRSDFIDTQYATFKKFLTHPFEYLVFNNGPDYDAETRENVAAWCQKNGIRCVNLTGRVSMPESATYSLRNTVLREYQVDRLLVVHFDIFLLTPFSIVDAMTDCDLYGYPQSKGHVRYLWPGLLGLNMATLPEKETIDLGGALVEGQSCDAGGRLAFYLKRHPGLRVKYVGGGRARDKLGLGRTFVSEIAGEYDGDWGFEIFEGAFYHYGRGTNWDRHEQSWIDKKMALHNEIIRRCMADEPVLRERPR